MQAVVGKASWPRRASLPLLVCLGCLFFVTGTTGTLRGTVTGGAFGFRFRPCKKDPAFRTGMTDASTTTCRGDCGDFEDTAGNEPPINRNVG